MSALEPKNVEQVENAILLDLSCEIGTKSRPVS